MSSPFTGPFIAFPGATNIIVEEPLLDKATRIGRSTKRYKRLHCDDLRATLMGDEGKSAQIAVGADGTGKIELTGATLTMNGAAVTVAPDLVDSLERSGTLVTGNLLQSADGALNVSDAAIPTTSVLLKSGGYTTGNLLKSGDGGVAVADSGISGTTLVTSSGGMLLRGVSTDLTGNTVSNSITEDDLIGSPSLAGSLTIPANALLPGSRITVKVVLSTNFDVGDQATLRLYFGALKVSEIDISGPGFSNYAEVAFDVQYLSDNGAGPGFMSFVKAFFAEVTAMKKGEFMTPVGAFDTTIPNDIHLTCQFAGASAPSGSDVVQLILLTNEAAYSVV